MTSNRRTYIRPVGHRVIVKPDSVEVMSESGIVISLGSKREESAQETGTVVAVGNQAFKSFCWYTDKEGNTVWGEPWCKEGDRIAHVKYAGGGNRIKDYVTGEEFIIINDSDIKAVLDPTEEDA